MDKKLSLVVLLLMSVMSSSIAASSEEQGMVRYGLELVIDTVAVGGVTALFCLIMQMKLKIDNFSVAKNRERYETALKELELQKNRKHFFEELQREHGQQLVVLGDTNQDPVAAKQQELSVKIKTDLNNLEIEMFVKEIAALSDKLTALDYEYKRQSSYLIKGCVGWVTTFFATNSFYFVRSKKGFQKYWVLLGNCFYRLDDLFFHRRYDYNQSYNRYNRSYRF